jgi:exopolysaccharide production protein ExoQ
MPKKRDGHYLPLNALARPITLSRLQLWGILSLWVIFMMGTSSASIPGVNSPERYFWLPADIILALLFFPKLKEFVTLAADNKAMLSWAFLAILSSLWSLAPGISVYHGVQLLLTVLAALLFVMHVDRLRMLQVVFASLIGCQLLSLAVVALAPGYGIAFGGEWKGAFPHKNVLGMAMALQILTGVCLFLQGWRRLLTGGTIVLAVALLALSRSGTSILATLVSLAPLPAAMFYRQGHYWFSLFIALLAFAGAAGLAILFWADVDPITAVLAGVGKDQTLTGRTVLWDIGRDAFFDRPWLGHGFKGYWQSPDTTVEYLRMLTGHNLWFFQNNYIEVAVAFGVFGFSIFAFGIAYAFVKCFRDFAHDGQYVTLWSLMFVIYLCFLCLGESPLFSNHSLHQFLLVAALAVRDAHERTPQRTIKLVYRGPGIMSRHATQEG